MEDDFFPFDALWLCRLCCLPFCPALLFSVQCTNVCPSSFAIEEDYGRARVMRQGVDTEDKLQEAIDTCPVSCIHWVSCRITLVCITFSKHSRASSQSSQT